MLYTCKHYLQSDRSIQQVKSKQNCVPKSNLETREENVNPHTKVVNVVNTTIGNYSKLFSLGDYVVTPDNGSDKEDSLDWIPNLVDDS